MGKPIQPQGRPFEEVANDLLDTTRVQRDGESTNLREAMHASQDAQPSSGGVDEASLKDFLDGILAPNLPGPRWGEARSRMLTRKESAKLTPISAGELPFSA